MKHLQDIIKESILDNRETLEQTAENNAYKHLLGPHSTSWGIGNAKNRLPMKIARRKLINIICVVDNTNLFFLTIKSSL